ncbi:beta-galactosidase [Sanguibacter keddieii DSM 10542]|uniref:Beta-galactosidase n=1 Tax=Sanguibacter keddieii (strain ATCC 51767 / DSM 10542 / NCFB 3025 / ST-74) TaxID=446469 RepID=D1BF65_SANKS|nr:beta-galactosidase [Sanguibacter keddieii]ACZ21361.1 beta-galactosidase [Sanguibacter keddieii DSM 10542]
MTAAPASTSPQTLVRLRAAGWPQPERAASMPDARDGATTITVTDRCLSRDGVPWVPVTGEMHYSRVPRHRWAETLRLMRAGGITVVATYLPWIHHQPERGTAPRFDDGLDVAELVRLAAAEGLDVVLRVGPWCHGEVRNGGLPDWVVAAPYTERTDDPAYLEDVRTWFGHLGDQLRDWCEPGGPVVGVQVENEIYDQPDHISTLKQIAREVGIRAPLWTATAWGGADIPVGDVFPMYGGYQDGFWLDTHDRWEDHGFAGQFSFSDQWDAPEIGADLAGDSRTAPVLDASAAAAPRPEFPPATCELGGGMASAYHRRIDAQGRDTAAIAHCKAGSGSVWQGYYMYAGGTNPGPDLQESHATGYPNDLPELNYDFRAPVGAHLQLRESFHRLRGQHAFLAAYGSRLAQMPSTAGSSPAQWALRSDGRSGFLYLSTHRPYASLPGLDGTRFEVDLDEQTVRVPHVPVDVPSGATAAWPVMLDLGETMLRWATATVLTRLDTPQGEPLLVLTAAPGVPVHLGFPADHEVTVERTGAESAGAGGRAAVLVDGDPGESVLKDVVPSATTVVRVDGPQGRARILVLSEEDALRAWTPTVDGRLRLVLTDAEAVYEAPGGETAAGDTATGLRVLTSCPASVDVLGIDAGAGYERHDVAHDVVEPRITVELVRAAREPAPAVVTVPDRASAPTASDVEERSARYRVTVTGLARAGERSLLRLDLVGDVARSTFDGRAEDLFWNGAEWDVDITPTTDAEERVVDVLVYPITDQTPVRLPERAEHARSLTTGPTAEIQSAEVLTFRTTTLSFP